MSRLQVYHRGKALVHTKKRVVTLPWCPFWLLPHVGEEPYLYLVSKGTYIIAADGVVIHQEIGVCFVLLHQVANPVRFISGLCPKVGR